MHEKIYAKHSKGQINFAAGISETSLTENKKFIFEEIESLSKKDKETILWLLFSFAVCISVITFSFLLLIWKIN